MKWFILLMALCYAGLATTPQIAFASWCIEAVDAPKNCEGLGPRAIAVDGNNPHIAYRGDHLYSAYNDGIIWLYETVDTAPLVGRSASIALDSKGKAQDKSCSVRVVHPVK
jgi:hypothetical protein